MVTGNDKDSEKASCKSNNVWNKQSYDFTFIITSISGKYLTFLYSIIFFNIITAMITKQNAEDANIKAFANELSKVRACSIMLH